MSARVYEIRPPLVAPTVTDAICAALCLASAVYLGPTWVGFASAAVAVALIAAAVYRTRRPPDRLTLDGDRVAWNDREYPAADVVVGPYFWARGLRRGFIVTFIDDDGPRTVVVAERTTPAFAELHGALGRATRADLRVFHPTSGRLRETLGAGAALALVFAVLLAVNSHVAETASGRAWAGAGFVPLALVAGTLLAVSLRAGPRAPLVVDRTRARVHLGAWYPADALRIGPIEGSFAPASAAAEIYGPTGERFLLVTDRGVLIDQGHWTDVRPLHTALVGLPGVGRDR